jgi:hypothetical protein
MKKANRTSVPAKLVLSRESLVVLGAPELARVAGASHFQGCTGTKQTSSPTGGGEQ